MKVYKVSLYDPQDSGGEHRGYSYFSNKEEAKRAARKENCKDTLEMYGTEGLISESEVQLTKTSILLYLNDNCGYPDNG